MKRNSKAFWFAQTLLLVFALGLVSCEGPLSTQKANVAIEKAARGAWAPNVAYVTGDTVTYQSTGYTCLQSHTSLVGWEPPNVPALWKVGTGGTTPTPTPTPQVTATPTPSQTVAAGFTSADADAAMNAFNNAFYTGSGNSYNYKDSTDGGISGFWTSAEMIEMVEDAYQRSGSTVYKNMIGELYNGFVGRYSANWSSNKFNDDITWMVIACLRAYEITGDTTYRTTAKTNFDLMWNRGYDTVLGGGLWWNTDKQTKNTCVNAPAAIAAYKLSVDLGDSNYLTKANNLFNWEKANLFNASTGSVYDNISSTGSVSTATFTYNLGTFIGAAHFLGDTANAQKALDYTKNNLAPGSILKNEGGGDGGGFKGIFCRWAMRFVRDRGLGATYYPWFQLNANTAWGNRDSRNLMDTNWAAKTGSGSLNGWACSSAVVLLQVCPPSGGVVFFKDVNYSGDASPSFSKGNYAALPAGIPDNWMSSLTIPSGWTVEAYENPNFGGTKWTFTASSTWVGSAANDAMSSFKIY